MTGPLRAAGKAGEPEDAGESDPHPGSPARPRSFLLDDPVRRVLWRLSLPTVTGLASTSLFGVTDAFFLGRLGTAELSAIGFSHPVVLVCTSVAIGLGVGIGAVVARLLGEEAGQRVRRVTSHGFLLSLLVSGLLAGLGLLTLAPLFRWLGAGPGVLPPLRAYMVVWYAGLPLLFLTMACTGTLRSTGDTRTPATVMILSAVLNAVLDPLLIFGLGPVPRMGIAGAAWAGLAARGAGVILCVGLLLRRDRLLEVPRKTGLGSSWASIGSIAGPATLAKLTFPLSMIAITALVARHGPEAVAALGVCGRLENLLMIPIIALATSMLPFVGQNWGAAQHGRVRRGLAAADRFAVAWGAVLFVLLLPGAPALASLFTDDPVVIAVAAMYLRILAISWGLQGVTAVTSSAFNAVGRPVLSMALTVGRMVVLYIPLAWIGSRVWGVTGIFVGGAVATAVVGLVAWRLEHTVLEPPARGTGFRGGLGKAALGLLAVGAGAGLVLPAAAVAPDRPFEDAPHWSIMEIQGAHHFSPLEGVSVATAGVMTLATRDGSGFWLQDPRGDADPATSDGLHVDLQGWEGERPTVGDRIRLVATVVETKRRAGFPRTGLASVEALEVLGRGVDRPAPIPVNDLPNDDISEAVAFWEPLEGMRVSVAGGWVVGPTNRPGEIALITDSDAVAGSGYDPESKVLNLRSLGRGEVDYNPERILVGVATRGTPLEARIGDRVTRLEGVVDYAMGYYKIQPETLHVESRGEPPAMPVSRRDGPTGDVRIVDLNLDGLFDTEDNPERFDENFQPNRGGVGMPSEEEVDLRLEKLALAVIHEMELPDLIVAQELETQEIFQALGDRVNERAGTRYRAVSMETSDIRGREVGFLFDERRVELVEYHQLGGEDVKSAFGIGSPFRNREPLVGVFRFLAGGPPVTVVANKFKSKRLDATIPNLSGTGGRVTERQRKVQARAVRTFVDRILKEDPEALILVAGDLGDFPFGEPEEGEHPVGILEGSGGGLPLTNLVSLEEPGEAYNWIFHGNGQILSHMLVSPALAARCVGADFLHFNGPFPESLRQDRTTSFRATDRDPMEARFVFRSQPAVREEAGQPR